jgi:hypothetical protein
MFKYATLSVLVNYHLQVACNAKICNPYTSVKHICSFKNWSKSPIQTLEALEQNNIQSRTENRLSRRIVYNMFPIPCTSQFIMCGSWTRFWCAYSLYCHSMGTFTGIVTKAWIQSKSVELYTEVWHGLRAINIKNNAQQSMSSFKAGN